MAGRERTSLEVRWYWGESLLETLQFAKPSAVSLGVEELVTWAGGHTLEVSRVGAELTRDGYAIALEKGTHALRPGDEVRARCGALGVRLGVVMPPEQARELLLERDWSWPFQLAAGLVTA